MNFRVFPSHIVRAVNEYFYVPVELIVERDLKTMSFFSLNRIDFIVLFYCFDFCFALSHFSLNEDMQTCFSRASIMFLVALNILIAFRVFEMFNNEKEHEIKIVESIRQEYNRIHNLKQKSLGIISKGKELNPEEENNILFEMHLLDDE